MSAEPGAWLRPEIAALSPYQVADAAGLIKLDAMENPHPFPAELVEAWLETLRAVPLNRYPSADAPDLKSALRATMGVPADCGILLGNGSDEILQMLMLALARPGASVLTPEPGFAMFRLIGRAVGLTYRSVPLAPDFDLDVPAMLKAIQTHQPALLLIAQPNNPTGNAFDRAGLEAIVDAAPGLVVVDEAYYPFADDHCLEWLGRYDNLLVMRTLSKLGLAGLRLGWLMGPPRWLDALEPLRLPYNINGLTQASAAFALDHYAAFMRQAEAIRAARSQLASALAALPGVTVYPSQANFLLTHFAGRDAHALHAALKTRGILVKNVSGAHPSLAGCLRLTVGTTAENRSLMTALSAILSD